MIKSTELVSLFKTALSEKWGYIWGTSGIKWTEARQKAATRDTTIKYGAKWIGHTVADCSGLFHWAFAKLGGYMYHGSDTMFRKYTTANGTLKSGKRTDGKELRPGTAVFVWKESEGKYTHVGLAIGGGKVIEAASTQKGVVSSNVTLAKWTHWGELKGVQYDSSEFPELRRGDKGEYVTLMQTKLIQRGYSCGSYGADGDFGSATEKAVKAFQKDNGIGQDGICGKKTWGALNAVPSIKYSVVIPHLSKSQADAIVSQYPGSFIEEERG